MEPVYTPEEIAHFAAAYKYQKERHNNSQKKYYQRNTEARLAYAKKYYEAKKAKAAPTQWFQNKIFWLQNKIRPIFTECKNRTKVSGAAKKVEPIIFYWFSIKDARYF